MSVTHPTFDGQHVITFQERNHTYHHPKHGIIPNATGVCKVMNKPALVPWAARKASEFWYENIAPGEYYDELQLSKLNEAGKTAHNIYSGERRDIGSHVHDWAEKMAHYEMGRRKTTPKMPVNPQIRKGCEAWKQWRRKSKAWEFEYAERVFFHPEDVHVGTADGWLCHNDTHWMVLDYKTGSGVWAEAGLQTAAYAMSASLEFGIPIEYIERCVVHLNTKSGNASVWDEGRIQEKLTGGDITRDYECFLGLLKAYNWIVDGPNKWSFLGK